MLAKVTRASLPRAAAGMTVRNYTAPLKDMKFLINNVYNFPGKYPEQKKVRLTGMERFLLLHSFLFPFNPIFIFPPVSIYLSLSI